MKKYELSRIRILMSQFYKGAELCTHNKPREFHISSKLIGTRYFRIISEDASVPIDSTYFNIIQKTLRHILFFSILTQFITFSCSPYSCALDVVLFCDHLSIADTQSNQKPRLEDFIFELKTCRLRFCETVLPRKRTDN